MLSAYLAGMVKTETPETDLCRLSEVDCVREVIEGRPSKLDCRKLRHRILMGNHHDPATVGVRVESLYVEKEKANSAEQIQQ